MVTNPSDHQVDMIIETLEDTRWMWVVNQTTLGGKRFPGSPVYTMPFHLMSEEMLMEQHSECLSHYRLLDVSNNGIFRIKYEGNDLDNTLKVLCGYRMPYPPDSINYYFEFKDVKHSMVGSHNYQFSHLLGHSICEECDTIYEQNPRRFLSR
jgi:hypothetical protein